jgi:3',5'-cyclic AMP phosphodiesterase CpdA
MAFVGDIQTPLWIESLLLGSDRNAEATDSIVADLIRRRPEHLFLLGDLVSFGPCRGSWERIDARVESLRRSGTLVQAILGNHEVMLFPRTGEKNFQSLFPDHVRTGYCRTVDSVAVILLNSNFQALSGEDARTQKEWFQRTLDSLQRDVAILHIVVCCHHSPFSNSRVVGGSEEVQREFVPPFLATPKCRLFLSGHAHTIEEFRQGKKTFLVIGGGGGARHPLRTGAGRKWEDLFPAKKPPFQYLEVRRNKGQLVAVVRGLRDNFSGLDDSYRLAIDGQDSIRSSGD